MSGDCRLLQVRPDPESARRGCHSPPIPRMSSVIVKAGSGHLHPTGEGWIGTPPPHSVECYCPIDTPWGVGGQPIADRTCVAVTRRCRCEGSKPVYRVRPNQNNRRGGVVRWSVVNQFVSGLVDNRRRCRSVVLPVGGSQLLLDASGRFVQASKPRSATKE